jgi:hypothetical protein
MTGDRVTLVEGRARDLPGPAAAFPPAAAGPLPFWQ